MMNPKKKERLEADGWTVGSTQDFLGLSHLQMAYVDLTIFLAEQIKRIRKDKGLTQSALANMMGSSQSRIAKLENADSSISFDLMIRALINLEVSPSALGWMILSSLQTEQEDSEVKTYYLKEREESKSGHGASLIFAYAGKDVDFMRDIVEIKIPDNPEEVNEQLVKFQAVNRVGARGPIIVDDSVKVEAPAAEPKEDE